MTQVYLDDFESFLADGGATPAWLAPVRRSAIQRFASLGFPTTKNEDWHFTSVAPIVEAQYATLRQPGGEVSASDLAPFTFGHDEWPRLVFVNGRYAPALSTAPGALPPGLRVDDLTVALADDGAMHGYLTTLADPTESAFTALNTALMDDGAVVRVAADTVVDVPVHLLFVADAAAAKGTSHPRNLILAGLRSRAIVIESYVALGEANYFTNVVTEVALAEGATLSHYKIQRESPRAFHVGTAQVRQARDSHYVSFSLAIGGALSRTNIYTTLAGEGSGATLHGLYMVDGAQHVDHQTRIEHASANCFSREVYKGILDGTSHGVFNGKVYVHPEAQRTDGKQTNNNLLLSERARVDTKPQLEIFADDVKCTHGATVGRIDETAMFYMRSRGVSHELARRLLTYAFAAEVLEHLEVAAVREELEALTLRRFTATETR